MSSFDDLTIKIQEIIRDEKKKGASLKYLNASHAKLLSQIVGNYNLKGKKEGQSAKVIILGAPTGAGKDILVRKLKLMEPDRNYVILNMDIFRHYHDFITGLPETMLDKEYAKKTNQTSYEIYYIIQETILREYPGTNIIVTGTIKDIEWIKNIIRRYRNDKKTNYRVILDTLAVEKNESAFSIFERYLTLVDSRDKSARSLRFTDIGYHNATTRDFIRNVSLFEKNMNEDAEEKFFDEIKVFYRNKDIFDVKEDTIIYDSDDKEKYGESCIGLISQKMNSISFIENSRVERLIEILKKNKRYLVSQGLYKDILNALREILISQIDVSGSKLF